MTACRLMLSSRAAVSSSLSISWLKSMLTRWIGGIIWPVFVKYFDTSFPRSASFAMTSAETGFADLRVVFIQGSFLLRGFPKCDEVIVFSFFIFPHFKNNGIELSANPAYSPILFRVVASLIEVVRMRPDLLHLFESYTAPRI